MRNLAVFAAIGAAISVSACSSTNIAAATTFVQALNAAGCTGTLDITGTAATAAMGVPSASLSNNFHGQCGGKPAATPAP